MTGVVIRAFEPADGDMVRELWRQAGFRLIGDDDEGLARFAERNPGLFLVGLAEPSDAARDEMPGTIVASAMGAWDGRRGWIYHVTTATSYRRKGIAATLVARIEAALADLGAQRVNVLVRDGNDGGHAFWQSAGYELAGSRQYGKPLSRADLARG
jgi:ribosomal protein S18 acetylase RimI-like enzyme